MNKMWLKSHESYLNEFTRKRHVIFPDLPIVRFGLSFSRPLAVMVVTITVSVTGITVDGTANIVSGFGIGFSFRFGFSISRSLAQVVTTESSVAVSRKTVSVTGITVMRLGFGFSGSLGQGSDEVGEKVRSTDFGEASNSRVGVFVA